MKKFYIILLLLSILLASCNNESGKNSSKSNLLATNWKLVELYGQEISYEYQDQNKIHMVLDSNNNEIRGFAGCNNFRGTFTSDDIGRLRINEDLTSTMMICPNSDLEDKFFEMLKIIDNYSISAENLYLNKARMAPLAKFIAE